jgi:hypothetical protein
MKRTVLFLLLLLAGSSVWTAPALADVAPPPEPPEEAVLSMVSESERPLGSPPLLVIYMLLAALGVRIAMSKPPAEA